MSEYKTFINKKRRPLEEKSKAVLISERLEAVKSAQRLFEKANEMNKKKYISVVRKHEAMSKVLGYEACRRSEDIPMMHKMIREIEQIRAQMTKEPSLT